MSKSTIESVVIFIILIIGIVGVISIIRPGEDAYASPNQNIEKAGKSYSLSQQEIQKRAILTYAYEE